MAMSEQKHGISTELNSLKAVHSADDKIYEFDSMPGLVHEPGTRHRPLHSSAGREQFDQPDFGNRTWTFKLSIGILSPGFA